MTGDVIRNPYPGLRPFRPDESTLFFGRDEQIGEVLERLMRQKLLAVVGVSGCGKSSLVTAGMIPALEMGLAGDPTQRWRVEIMRPGDGPLRELQRCLGFGDEPLAERTYGLREAVKEKLPPDETLLLVVDQFEEIFPFRERMREGGGSEADLFISYLLSATADPSARIYVILTMRSDYLGECAKFHGLPEVLNDGQYLVPRMIRPQLQEAIESPMGGVGDADAGSVAFHPGLVQKLLNDCAEEPDNLPLLQHLLSRLFERWRKDGAEGQITRAMAKEVGELSDALDRDAEAVFQALSPDRQRTAETLLRRITESRQQSGGGEDDRPVRRPQTVRDLAELARVSEAELRAVVDRFVQRGLLVVRATDEGDKVDLPHECVCLKWGRLHKWIEDEARDAKALRFLADSVGKGHLTGTALAEAGEWQEAGRLETAWGSRYLSADGMREVDGWVTESRDRIARQVRAAKRRRVLAFVGVVVLASVAVGASWVQRRAFDSDALAGIVLPTADTLPAGWLDSIESDRGTLELDNAQFAELAYELEDMVARRELNDPGRAEALGERVRTEFIARRGAPPSEADDTLLNRRIRIEGGTFRMGQGSGAREVTLSSFSIQQHEVTNGEYARFDSAHAFPPGRERHPVAGVTWYDAMAYAVWLGGTLPTEAQWEFAARGREGREYPWGDEQPTCERAHYSGCPGDAIPVMSKPAGATLDGVHDLAGNMWEWVSDWYGPYRPRDVSDPRGIPLATSRVLRGGSFGYGPNYLRGAFRVSYAPVFVSGFFGFRVAWPGGQD